jgi:uncharacterized membrane protein (UPF0127 family)
LNIKGRFLGLLLLISTPIESPSKGGRRLILLAAALFIPLVLSPAADVLPESTTATVLLAGRQLVAELAVTPAQRVRGLAGRKFLRLDQGMLFIYRESKPRTFWMAGMKMPIDLVWLSGRRVVGIESRLEPPSPNRPPRQVTSPVPVDMVLEVRAGWCEAAGLRPGDRVEIAAPPHLALPPANVSGVN